MADYLTFDDAVQHLAMLHNIPLEGRTLGVSRQAVLDAYRRIPSMHDWNYYRRMQLIHIPEPYSTGTVTYENSSRTLTLTGGTFPNDVIDGRITIDRVSYEVSRRISSTALELAANLNPGKDITSGVSYEWVKLRHLLSDDFGSVIAAVDPERPAPLGVVRLDDAMFLSESGSSLTFPSRFAVVRSQNYPSRWEFWIPHNVYSGRTVRVLYIAKPVQPKIFFESGTGASINTQEVTMPSSTVRENHVGSVIRISANTSTPTPNCGRQAADFSSWENNPFQFESVISDVDVSGNKVYTADSSETVLSGKAWSISSHLDVNRGAMQNLLHKLAEEQYLNTVKSDSRSERARAREASLAALVEAQIEDTKTFAGMSPLQSSWPLGLSDIGRVIT